MIIKMSWMFLLYLSQELWHYKLYEAFWLMEAKKGKCICGNSELNVWLEYFLTSTEDIIQYASGSVKPLIIPMSAKGM